MLPLHHLARLMASLNHTLAVGPMKSDQRLLADPGTLESGRETESEGAGGRSTALRRLAKMAVVREIAVPRWPPPSSPPI